MSLTAIAEFGSVCAFSKTLFIKSAFTTSLSTNFKIVGKGNLSKSGYSVKYLAVRAFNLMFG